MLVDGLNVRSKIEQPAHALDNRGKGLDVRKEDADAETLLLREVRDSYASHCAVHFHRAQVALVFHYFNTRNRTRTQKAEHALPVIGRPIPKLKNDVLLLFFRSALSAQSPRRALEQMKKCLVESPHAAET